MKTDLFKELSDDTGVETIAMESELLETIFSKELAVIAAPRELGNSWYSAALEDASFSDNKSAVARLIEYIQKFIARIIEAIKSMFDKKSSEEDIKFIRGYQGPTDQQLAKAIGLHITTLAKSDESVQERLKTLPALTYSSATLDQAEEHLEAATDRKSVV